MPEKIRKTTGSTRENQSDILVLPQPLLDSFAGTSPKSAQVYAVLRKAIVEMIMPPGSPVNERHLCEQFGISRTPLREALLRLQDENLIRIVPNSGTYVSRIDLEAVFEGQLVRAALETKVVALAATRITAAAERKLDVNMFQQHQLAEAKDYENFYAQDEAMHELICEIGASVRVWRVIHSAKAQLDRVRRLAIPLPSHLQIVLEEHDAIVTGLKLRDPDRAAAAMEKHVGRVFEDVRHLIIEQKEFFSAGSRSFLDDYSPPTHSARKPG